MAVTFLSMERIEKERLIIPVAAFQFWEQQDFKALLNETTDKSASYKFNPEEEKMQGIVQLLIEMLKIRRIIKMLEYACIQRLQMNSSAKRGRSQLQDTELLTTCAKLNVLELRKCSNNYQFSNVEMTSRFTRGMNYLILALAAYKTTTEVIFGRLVNVTIVC